MEFKFTISTNDLNDPADIEDAIEDIKLLIRFLQRANPNYYLIGDLLDEQLTEQLKKIEPAEPEYPKLISDFSKGVDMSEILSLLNVSFVHDFSVKIVRDQGFNRTDAHVPCIKESYDYADDLIEYLTELIDSEDCKNGCQIYEEEDGTRYLQITGANFYDKDDNYAGTNNIKVYVKEFVW